MPQHNQSVSSHIRTHASARAPAHANVDSFAGLGVPAKIVSALTKAGIETPFPVQSGTIPPALAGRDLCGRAPTGSGKTLAFGIPVAARAARAKPHRPTALILCPTRELASQITEVMRPLAGVSQRRISAFYGGTSLNRDMDRLRRGVDIAVATPGRLADLVRRQAINLSEVAIVVLDEADRMADMGFLPEVRRLLDLTSANRQTLLFSATLDGDVDVLVRHYQRDPVRHEVLVPAEDIGQVNHLFWPAERPARRKLTADVVRHTGPAIVFTRTKHGADRLARDLAKDGIRAAAIHGDRSQRQREKALQSFADGRVTTLVATDVAARGIHVDGVSMVVHFDLPASDKDYVHRSGRTGRAGARGVVLSLVSADQHRELGQMQRQLGMASGLHDIELDQLTADSVPQPRALAEHRSYDRPAGRSGQRSGRRPANGSRSGSGSGGGHGGRGATAKTGRGSSGQATAQRRRRTPA